MMETKELAPVFDLKAIDDATGTFSGYGAIFGNVDSQGEIVMNGAFAKSLGDHRRKGTRPKMFWQHDPRQPIGKWSDLAEDGKGLFAEGQLNMDVQQGREAFALLKGEAIDGLSIGFRVVKAEPDPKTSIVRLIELNLMEISVVSLASNDRARVDTVKAEVSNLYEKLSAGDRLSEREWEIILKAEPFGFSNSQAERAVRVNLKRGQGDPGVTAELVAKQARSALREALAAFK